jgi:proteasome alpha subunit
VLQQEYSADMSVEQAVALSNKAIERALGERPVIEVGVVSTQEKQFQKLR